MARTRRLFSLLLVAMIFFGGTAAAVTGDADDDGIGDAVDNCPSYYNPNQADWNTNGKGDACDDTDGDGLSDAIELSQTYGNGRKSDPTKKDTDGDGYEDGTEYYGGTDPTNPDTDGDGRQDPVDNCPVTPNPDQADWNNNGKGDACGDPRHDPTQEQIDAVQDRIDETVGTVTGLLGPSQGVVDQVLGLIPHPDAKSVADLNRMATDGYIVKISRENASTWFVQILKADTLQPVGLDLPSTPDQLTVNGPVQMWAYDYPTSATTPVRVNIGWRYLNSNQRLLEVHVLAGQSHNGAFTMAVPPIGYPTSCGTQIPNVNNTCDGHAVGYFNAQKSLKPMDALDAVPTQTTIQGG